MINKKISKIQMISLVLISATLIYLKVDFPNVFTVNAKQLSSTATVTKNYKGKINNNIEIHMTLNTNRKLISGTYYYDKYKKSITLKGTVSNTGLLKMDERNSKGLINASFEAKLLPGDYIEGVWHSDDSIYKFYVSTNGKERKISNTSKKSFWEGERNLVDSSYNDFSSLDIKYVTDSCFWFKLEGTSGANVGEIVGLALLNKTIAVFSDSEGSEVKFIPNNQNINVIANNKAIMNYCGNGVNLNGEYTKNKVERKLPTLKEHGIFTTIKQEDQFKKLVGKEYNTFLECSQLITEEEDLDNFKANAYNGMVEGLAGSMEYFIMIGPEGEIWAAIISNEKIHYYTNTKNKNILPKTIDKWVSGFPDLKLIYESL